MARIWIPGGGGGADLDVITAEAGHVLAGKVIVDKDGNPLSGTMPDNTGTALEVATNGKTLIPKGYHDGTQYATNTQATMAGGTKTPTTSAQTIACNGKLMTSNIVIAGSSSLVAANIVKGITIFGVTGTAIKYVQPSSIYNAGTWGDLDTTGVSKMTGGTVTAGASSITMYYVSNFAQARLNSAVDLTDYKYLKVKMKAGTDPTSSGTSGFGISTSSTLTGYGSLTKKVTTTVTSTSTLVLDISSYSGLYWIYLFGIGANASACTGFYTITLSTT